MMPEADPHYLDHRPADRREDLVNIVVFVRLKLFRSSFKPVSHADAVVAIADKAVRVTQEFLMRDNRAGHVQKHRFCLSRG